MSRLMNVEDDLLLARITGLRQRHFLMMYSGLSHPGEFFFHPENPTLIPEAEFEERQRRHREWIKEHTTSSHVIDVEASAAAAPQQTLKKGEDKKFLKDYIALLKAIAENEGKNLPAEKIYGLASLKGTTGFNRKRDLLQLGMVEEELGVSSPQCPKPPTVLKLTEKGKEFLLANR